MIRRTKRMAQGTDILGILAILAFSLATETAVGETALRTPKILSVTVDFQGNFLVLNGGILESKPRRFSSASRCRR